MIDKPIFDFVNKGTGVIVNVPEGETLGIYLCTGPTNKLVGEEDANNQIGKFNYTGPPGTAAALYYALVFMLNGDGYHVHKVDEWIEVSPGHAQYYQSTVQAKKQLEAQIKEGIASAASEVANFELLNHDLRKYKQIVKYFAEKDEASLKAMFIDQVDVHNGPLAMVQLVGRWPTLIADFQKLTEKDMEAKEIAKKLSISEAEAMVLRTKNKLYTDWKKEFGDAVRKRYESILALVQSKQRTVDEYRNWLKPYLTRYKMMKLGGESPAGRMEIVKSFADLTGQATFTNGIQIWAWTTLKPAEARKEPLEKEGEFIINPYDPWIRKHMILNDKNGLASIYPWLKNERKYCPQCKKYSATGEEKCKCGAWFEKRTVADEMVEDVLNAWKNKEMSLNPSDLYYSFFVIDVFRAGSRLPIGEIEDITFGVYSYLISQNVLLVKLLELRCRELEFNMYMDEILGIRAEGEGSVAEMMRRDFPQLFEQPKEKTELERFSLDLKKISDQFSTYFKGAKAPKVGMFAKAGPYETDFADRITRYYMSVSGGNFNMIKNFLKSKMGVG